MARTLRSIAGASSLDLGEIGRLLRELEERLAPLAGLVAAQAREAGSAVPERISEGWSDLSDRLRSVRYNARDLGEEASRLGTGALRRLEHEAEHRPLMVLAMAVGIGFVLGSLNRR